MSKQSKDMSYGKFGYLSAASATFLVEIHLNLLA